MVQTNYPLPNILREVALVYLDKNDFGNAEKYFHCSLAITPKDPKTNNALGTLYAKKKDYAKAENYFIQAITQNPDFILARLNLADNYRLQNKVEDAIREYELVLKENLNWEYHPEAITNLALLYIKTHRMENFLKTIQHLYLNKSFHKNLIYLFYAIHEEGFPPLSKLLLDNHLKYFPNDTEAYLCYGVILANENEMEKAIKIWRRGIAIDPGDPRFQANINKATHH